jgi:VWFA-related protein
MRTSIKTLLLLALLAAGTQREVLAQAPTQAVTQTPQQPTPPPLPAPNHTPLQPNENGIFTVKTTSRLVVLDVVVSDRKGNLVTNLKREDFSVTEAKEPQTILNFEAPGANQVAPEVTINSTADLDRLAPRAPVNIILLDEFNTRFEDMAFARYSLKKFLEKQPEKLTTPTMLIAVDLQHFTVLHDYTQDKRAVIDALNHHLVAYPWQQKQKTWVPERLSRAFGTLMRVAEATVGHPGHKNMIWIGRGLPPLDLANLQADSATRVENAVQECVNMLRDARVTLYSIDPAGLLVDPMAYGQDAADVDPFGGNYTFNGLAKATGGKALYGRNDVDAEIGTTVRDGTSFYTLTYRPQDDSMDPQKFRKIAIKLSRPDLVVSAREGYYVRMPPDKVNPQSPSQRLAFDLVAAETSTMAYDGIPITVQPKANEPGTYQIHIEGRGLEWTDATATEPRRAEVALLATTFDKKGKELKRIARVVTVSASGDVAPTGKIDRNVNLQLKLDPDEKAVRARVVVRVAASGRIGTADVTLTP